MHQLLPDDPEVAGLLALMLLTDARRAARAGPSGELIPMAEQDRSLWNAAYIAEGVAAGHRGAAARASPGRTSSRPPSPPSTTRRRAWKQRTGRRSWPCTRCCCRRPTIRWCELNHAVAVGMAQGPRAGLGLIDKLQADARLAEDYRLHAVRAHLQEMAGERRSAHVTPTWQRPNARPTCRSAATSTPRPPA